MSGETTRAGGIRFERKVVNNLRSDGYTTMRSAGSKGSIDIAAMKPGQLLLVGAKRGGVCTAAEWDRLVELAGWVGAVPILAVNGPRGYGVDYWRLTGPKQRGKPMAAQPAERFLTDEVAGPVRQEWVEIP